MALLLANATGHFLVLPLNYEIFVINFMCPTTFGQKNLNLDKVTGRILQKHLAFGQFPASWNEKKVPDRVMIMGENLGCSARDVVRSNGSEIIVNTGSDAKNRFKNISNIILDFCPLGHTQQLTVPSKRLRKVHAVGMGV